MADDVLKGFLVSLGFKIDRSSEKKFNNAVADATKNIAKLTIALEAMAIAAATAITKVAQQFDQLYFASQRVGASAGNIKAFSYGVSQLGGTAAGAQSSLENFARFMKMNPQGSEALLKQYGVTTRDANGQLRDRTKLISDLGKALNGKSFAVRSYVGEIFGIDESTLTALGRNIDVFAEQYRASMRKAGLDPDKAAADGNKLATTWRQIGAAIDIIGAKVTSRLFGTQDNVFKEFLDFLDRNGDKIAEIIEKVVKAVIALATALLKLLTSKEAKDFLDGILSTLGTVDEKTGKWEASIDSLQTALKVFAAYVLTTWVAKLLLAFRLVGAGWGGLLASFGIGGFAGASLLAGAGIAGAATAAQLPGQVAKGNVDPATGGALDANPMGDIGKENSGKLGKLYRRYAPTWLGGRKPNIRYGDKPGAGGGGGGGGTASIGKISRAGNARAIIDELRAAGYNDNAVAAIVGSMQTESGLNPAVPENSYNRGHIGLWQWDRNRWPRIKKWIEGQGGDPMDARWQTKAWIAEHNAKPGDPMYDHPRTAKGGAILRGNPTIDEAIHGVRESERFGAGEEGGRGAKARGWLPHLDTIGREVGKATKISDAQVIAADDGHWSRVSRALGDKDFAAMHGNYQAAQMGGINRSSTTTNSPTFTTTITGISDASSAAMTIDRNNRRLTKEFFERGVPQGN